MIVYSDKIHTYCEHQSGIQGFYLPLQISVTLWDILNYLFLASESMSFKGFP